MESCPSKPVCFFVCFFFGNGGRAGGQTGLPGLHRRRAVRVAGAVRDHQRVQQRVLGLGRRGRRLLQPAQAQRLRRAARSVAQRRLLQPAAPVESRQPAQVNLWPDFIFIFQHTPWFPDWRAGHPTDTSQSEAAAAAPLEGRNKRRWCCCRRTGRPSSRSTRRTCTARA